jgi:hypothetical protein
LALSIGKLFVIHQSAKSAQSNSTGANIHGTDKLQITGLNNSQEL